MSRPLAAAVLEQLRELGDRTERTRRDPVCYPADHEASTREQLLKIALVHVLECVESIAECTHEEARKYAQAQAGDRRAAFERTPAWCLVCGGRIYGQTAILAPCVAVLRTNVDQLRAALGILPAQQGPAGTWKPKDEGHA